MTTLRGKWAQGLQPRNFCWIIRDRIAVGERPGGFARNHRKVRRQEELIWLGLNNFTHLVSLLDSPHNLRAYEEAGLSYAHVPLGRRDEIADRLAEVYGTLDRFMEDPAERLYVHYEEFGDRLLGAMAGYLLHSGLVSTGPQVVTVIEKLTARTLGSEGREIVATTLNLPRR